MKRTLLLSCCIGILLLFSFIFLRLSNHWLGQVIPTWNDEDFYYKQVEAVLKYGRPLGYYGYQGSHAHIGTFGAHGFFILTPYVLFSALFGLNYYTIALVNNVLLAVAIFLAIVLLKPGKIQIIGLLLL